MTTVTASIDVVAQPAADSLDIANEIDSLVALQAQIADLEANAREIRARVKEAMVRFKVDRFTSPSGHCATLFTMHRTDLNRERAAELLSPAILDEITKSTSSLVLRVR